MSFPTKPVAQMSENLAPVPGRRASGIVSIGVFLAVIALGLMTCFTPLKTWLAEGGLIKAQLESFGLAAPVVFTAAAALLTVFGVPRLLLCSLGGLVFGFIWGLAWTQAGTLLGAYATFLAVRWKGRDHMLSQYPRLRCLSQHLESQGLMSVILIRQIPINGFYNNVLLGLTPVSHGDFLLGSLLGFLPLGLTACLLGAGLIQRDWLTGMQYTAFGLACSVVLGQVLNRRQYWR